MSSRRCTPVYASPTVGRIGQILRRAATLLEAAADDELSARQRQTARATAWAIRMILRECDDCDIGVAEAAVQRIMGRLVDTVFDRYRPDVEEK